VATSPDDIIDAIDAAILAMMNGGGAQTIAFGDGRSMSYTDLDKLKETRDYYYRLANATDVTVPRTGSITFGGMT
jgi:hypothetical protein